MIASTSVSAQSVAGAYLAGRQASISSDFGEAATFFTRALARDPGNVELMDRAVLAYLSLGDVPRALPVAKTLEASGQVSQVTHMTIQADLMAAEDWGGVLARDTLPGEGIGPWVDGLIKAWAHMALGEREAAITRFDTLAKEQGMQGFALYHKALSLAMVGDFVAAEAIFSDPDAGITGQTRRGVFAQAEILSQLGRNEDAVQLLRQSFGSATDPELRDLLADLEAGETVPFTHVPNARAGMAEVFYSFAVVLRAEQAGAQYTILFARVAQHLRPAHVDALLLTADLLEGLDQQQLAIAEYKKVPSDDPAFHAAELGRAAALRRLDRNEQAVEVLEQLARSHGDLAVVHSTLGDTLRRQDQFEPAIAAYGRALERTDADARSAWVLYYARGIAYERSGNWDSSEADFRKALELNPDQPQVLNYLGYSLVEQNRALDEALDMIKRAVAGDPDSGYIVDSLGWAYYRLGRYEEAVVQMERAVELLAVDPVINDHLGDVYWAVGRYREAEFQWRRALSFVDDETDTEAEPDRIRRKLEVGLDAVLADEGAPPLKVASDD